MHAIFRVKEKKIEATPIVPMQTQSYMHDFYVFIIAKPQMTSATTTAI